MVRAMVNESAPSITLHQLPFSHYNEKARWALDYKSVPHQRRSYLPGLHMPAFKRRAGRTSSPLLEVDGRFISESAVIIDFLERRYPEPALYPAEFHQRQDALRWQQWLDLEVGHHARRAFFQDFLRDGDYAANLMSHGQAGWVRWLYRKTFPASRALARRLLNVNADSAARSRDKLRQALDAVAEATRKRPYLVGERFSVADLTAASLLVVVCFPPQFAVPVPLPGSPGMRRWLALWQDHPATAWVRDIYDKHRIPAS